MSEAALSRISNLIKYEDDLQKIESLRQQFQKEKKSTDVKLNTATQEQILSIVSNFAQLKTSADKLDSIKGNIDRINTMHDDAITNVKEYETIQRITTIHQTMMQVQSLYTDIANYRKFLDHINKMIDAELQVVVDDIKYPLVNIHRIHYNVTQARNLAEYLQVESTRLSDDVQLIVDKIVAPVRTTVRNFDTLLKEIVISITEAYKDGNSAMVYKLIQVLRYENDQDLRAVLREKLELLSADQMRCMDYATYRAKPRNYMKFFYDKLEESIKDTFSRCADHFEDKMDVYDSLGWLDEELEFVVHSFDPLFPTSWKVADYIESVYYNELHKFTMRMINTNPPAEDLMRILDYDSYYAEMVSGLHSGDKEKSKKMQKSILGEELKASVLDDYMRVIILKMSEWNQNLMDSESKNFILRDIAPDTYSYSQSIEDLDAYDHLVTLDVTTDVYVLPDFKTTLQMLRDHADVAAKSGYGRVLVEVIEHWSKLYVQRIENFMNLVNEEVGKYMTLFNNDKFLIRESKAKRFFRFRSQEEPELDLDAMSEEEIAAISKPGLNYYLTALANTYEINADRLQDKFMPSYMDKVHSLYRERIETAMTSTIGPSTELNANVVRAHADMIVNDLLPALSEVFKKSWYDDSKAQAAGEPNMAQLIVQTIAEAIDELKSFASYDLYTVTFSVTLDTFISTYIRIGFQNILHGDGKKIDPTATKKYKSFPEAISRDVGIFYEGLDPLFSRRDAMYLVKSLSAIEFLADMATFEHPFDEIPQFWEHEVLPSFADCSLDYVRGILLCRKDIDTKQIPSLMERLLAIQQLFQIHEEELDKQVGTLKGFRFD